jgi:hypothetical protein
MGSRSKIGAPDQIGRFGIGFVSVYQITDTPIVRSTGTQLKLDPLSGKGVVSRIPEIEGTEFELPWAAEASDIRAELHAAPTPPDVVSRAVAEISDTLRSSLLFLRSLTKVEVRENGRLRIAVEINRDNELVTLDFGPEGQDRWLVLSGDASDEIETRELTARFDVLQELKRNRSVSVAIPVESADIEGRLFAYLPTQHLTGLPLHINADFFPHASRQDIVLKGESHERYWNEAMIGAAARIIGANFSRLRDALGPSRLWELGSAAFKVRRIKPFDAIWTEFEQAAKANASISTIDLDWRTPDSTYLAPEVMPAAELAAISGIGIFIINDALRPHFTAMSAVGARELTLTTVTTVLEERKGLGISPDNPHLSALWCAVERLVLGAAGRPGSSAVLTRLKAATFLVGVDGRAASPDELWWLPPGVEQQDVRRYLEKCRIASDNVSSMPNLVALMDEMVLDDFADLIASVITSDTDALTVIGPDPRDARRFYSLLLAFPTSDSAAVGKALADTPILRAKQGFVAPSRAQMPGNFQDPTGYFELIDTTLFPSGMDAFARETLGVEVLSFPTYIDTHLPTILKQDLTREQYRAIMAQMNARKNELEDGGSLDRLRDLDFVRTRASTFRRPGECYYWTAALAAILGDEPTNWVDSSWMPSSTTGAQVQDLFEGRLGMPVTVTARHIVDRIEGLAREGTIDEIAERLAPIVRHMIDRWPRFDEDDLEIFRELQDLEFLPAVVNGMRDQENLYLPSEVYRAGRAPGFDSQVPIIDLSPLRAANAVVRELLDLLDAPEEPETSVVVAHLQHCMANDIAPSELTYAILNERVEGNDDVASIRELEDSPFIYDRKLERFLLPNEVFWLPPPFKDYWWRASDRMGQRSALFTLLGVKDEPSVEDYVALMLRIASSANLTVEDIEIHRRCVGRVCEALESGEPGLNDALHAIRSDCSLLTVDGEPIWPEDAIWLDQEHLAEPFGTELNGFLVLPPDVLRTSAARLFQQLQVPPLSDVARLRLADRPDGTTATGETELLNDRADLILWLAPNPASRTALRRILQQIELRHTDTLRVQAEIRSFEPPVTSAVSEVPAFYDVDTGALYVIDIRERINWPAAFRAIFAEVEHLAPLADIKPLVTTATLIMRSADRDEAEQALIEAGYRAPVLGDDIISGEVLDEGEDLELDVSEADDLSDEDEGVSLEDEGEFGNSRNDTIEYREHDEECDGEGGHRSQECEANTTSSNNGMNTGTSNGSAAQNGQLFLGSGGSNVNDGRPDQEYKSKAGTGGIGKAEPSTKPTSGAGQGTHTLGNRTIGHGSDGSRERRARTSRMRTYVGHASDQGPDGITTSNSQDDINALVDLAAVKAAMKYEEQRGWRPEEQPHNNPGYDIVSHGPVGERRLIEVKGLENEWTGRGVKLSHVQFGMAQSHPHEYWIYVVERARELGNQRVNAIGNPFQKVDEYWFDDAWRALSDEGVSAQQLNVVVGAKVRHQLWGTGRIIDVQKGGIATKVKIDFGYEGVKFVPFNSSLTLVED